MFEGNTPPNLPALDEKVEDIFAPVEPVKSMPPTGGAPDQPAPRETPRTGFKRLLIIVIGVLVLGGVVWAGYAGLRSAKQAAKIKPAPRQDFAPQNLGGQAPTEVAPTPAPVATAPAEIVPESQREVGIPIGASGPVEGPQPVSVDTDGDGLTDEEEAQLGTNPQNVDSDNDALSDREEVKVYKSDPLNPDTDGDGYQDGHEVKNNYSPTGTGKLLPQLPAQ